jgi:CelD/BcsL family acetyltransferase involved in cellulose biosynthesis
MVMIDVLAGAELSAQHARRWSDLQLADPDLASPFFRPEFAAAVADARRDVFVAVVEEAGTPVGFFPFQRGPWGAGKPLGGPLSDYHGAILERSAELDPVALLRACGLRVWDFTHLVASQEPFRRYHARLHASPVMDLSAGFAAYHRSKSSAGSMVIAQADRKARKLGREVGALRFVADDPDPAALRRLMRWKSDQYRRTNVTDTFASRWRADLIERIHATHAPAFAGVLSTLHAGERLVAAHLGMRSRDALHWWFPAYDPQFARFSPGLVLLMQLARSLEQWGVRTIDLGVGDEPYKRRLMTASVPLAQGAVALPGPLTAGRQLTEAAKHVVRHTPLARPGRRATRWVRRQRDEYGAGVR